MRRIESTERRERRQKRNGIIIGVVLIVLMVSSTIGFIFAFGGGIPDFGGNSGGVSPDLTYNGVDFFNINNLWIFEVLGARFETSLEPAVTESTKFDFEVEYSNYLNKPIYFVYDEESIAQEELMRNFGEFTLRQNRACLEGETCNGDFPVRTCENNVIIISSSEEIKAYKEQNCIFIEGTSGQQLLLADKLIYSVLDVQ